MATRATYSFEGPETNACIYIHWDGYPEGAAAYFYEMLVNPSKGNLATQFIRANPDAGLTVSHAYHGDTEYRYSVTSRGRDLIKAEKAAGNGWVTIFHGLIYDFVNKYMENSDYKKDFDPFRLVELEYVSMWMNIVTAKKILNEEHRIASALPTLMDWDVNKTMPRTAANYRSVAKQVLRIVNAFPDLMTEEIRELTTIPEEVV